MSGQWRLINTAPQHVKNVASIIDLRPGDDRLRTFADLQDGRLRYFALWAGPSAGDPITHWLDEPLPEPPQ